MALVYQEVSLATIKYGRLSYYLRLPTNNLKKMASRMVVVAAAHKIRQQRRLISSSNQLMVSRLVQAKIAAMNSPVRENYNSGGQGVLMYRDGLMPGHYDIFKTSFTLQSIEYSLSTIFNGILKMLTYDEIMPN